MLLSVFCLIFASFLGVLLVEIVSYVWHRFAEHGFIFGVTIGYRHWLHHEENYPVESLRPQGVAKYKTVHPWSWYTPSSMLCVLIFLTLPLSYAIAIFIGGAIHGTFIVLLHETFHIEGYYLNRFGWYRRLVKIHDIHHYGPWNYGIAFFWIDWLLGTMNEKLPAEKRENFRKVATA